MSSKWILVAAGVAILVGMASDSQAQVKNVILMISDGQGFNTVRATDYYVGAAAVYEGLDWVRLGMQTNSANNPLGYNAAAMLADFNYARTGATDSASAATAMYTGEKNYDGQINWSTSGSPLTTIFEYAAAAGRSIGAVSSVQLSHATPAAVYAHNASRNNYADIALEAINGDYNGNLKVVMGAGHPEYNDNGGYDASVSDRYVGNAAGWTALQGGANGWALVETRTGFQNLATGATPDKVFGVAQVNGTLQYNRSGTHMDPTNPFNTNVPTLEDMTKAALNVLDNNPNGFAVMIEGGAVDWANHAGNMERMIEEQIDYNNAVAYVSWYLDNNINGNNWSNTLVISTADHECGHVWGPSGPLYIDENLNGVYDSGIDTFLGYDQVTDNGAGNVPGVAGFSGNHTNALVPLFARGAGSELFANYIIGTDPNLQAIYNLDGSWTGQFVDNTAIFNVMADSAIPEPATMSLLGLGLLGLVIRRRRAR